MGQARLRTYVIRSVNLVCQLGRMCQLKLKALNMVCQLSGLPNSCSSYYDPRNLRSCSDIKSYMMPARKVNTSATILTNRQSKIYITIKFLIESIFMPFFSPAPLLPFPSSLFLFPLSTELPIRQDVGQLAFLNCSEMPSFYCTVMN